MAAADAPPSPSPALDAWICFSDDWGRHPSSSQHLFRRLAAERDTLWVETIGLRPPRLTLSDARRVAEKLRRMAAREGASNPSAQGAEAAAWCETPARLTRLAPAMQPYYGPRALAALNDALVGRAVRRASGRLGLRAPVLLTTVPNAAGLLGRLGESRAVYYCVDDFETWPGYAGGPIRRMEDALLDGVDGLVVTAEALARRRGRPDLPCLVLPHGVDVAHFATPGAGAEAAAQALGRLGRPRLLSLGLFDERIDTALLRAVLDAHPAWHLALVGPRTAPRGPLDDHPRVAILPGVPYAEVPAWLAAADALIVPYVRNAQTDAINPLKLRELLATGRPVAGTALPEIARQFGALVPTGDGPAGFAAAVAQALEAADAGAARARQAAVAADDWAARADTLLRFVETLPARRRRP